MADEKREPGAIQGSWGVERLSADLRIRMREHALGVTPTRMITTDLITGLAGHPDAEVRAAVDAGDRATERLLDRLCVLYEEQAHVAADAERPLKKLNHAKKQMLVTREDAPRVLGMPVSRKAVIDGKEVDVDDVFKSPLKTWKDWTSNWEAGRALWDDAESKVMNGPIASLIDAMKDSEEPVLSGPPSAAASTSLARELATGVLAYAVGSIGASTAKGSASLGRFYDHAPRAYLESTEGVEPDAGSEGGPRWAREFSKKDVVVIEFLGRLDEADLYFCIDPKDEQVAIRLVREHPSCDFPWHLREERPSMQATNQLDRASIVVRRHLARMRLRELGLPLPRSGDGKIVAIPGGPLRPWTGVRHMYCSTDPEFVGRVSDEVDAWLLPGMVIGDPHGRGIDKVAEFWRDAVRVDSVAIRHAELDEVMHRPLASDVATSGIMYRALVLARRRAEAIVRAAIVGG